VRFGWTILKSSERKFYTLISPTNGRKKAQGTAVILSCCDRGDKIQDPTHLEQAKFELRRIFRYAFPHSDEGFG